MGIGQTKECFQSMGRILVEREELKMTERRLDIDKAVSTSIVVRIESKPADFSGAMQERRLAILSGRVDSVGKGSEEERMGSLGEEQRSY